MVARSKACSAVKLGGRLNESTRTDRDAENGSSVRALAVAVGIALVVRWLIAARLSLVEVDGAYWCGLARALAHGDWRHGLSTAWPPLFPAVTAIAARLTPASGPEPAH